MTGTVDKSQDKKQQRKAYKQIWYRNNRERLRKNRELPINRAKSKAVSRAWYAANKEMAKANSRARHAADTEVKNAKRRAWYAENKETSRATSRATYARRVRREKD